MDVDGFDDWGRVPFAGVAEAGDSNATFTAATSTGTDSGRFGIFTALATAGLAVTTGVGCSRSSV